MSRAVNAVVIGIAAMIVIVGVFWFFVDFLGAQLREAEAQEDDGPGPTRDTEATEPTEDDELPPPSPTTFTTTFVTTSATTGTTAQTFTSTATMTQTETQTLTPSSSTNASAASNGTGTEASPPSNGRHAAAAAFAPPAVLAAIDPGDVVRDLMEQASLALILGGLLMLGLVVALVMVRAMFSSGSDVGPRFKRPEPLHRATRATPELAASDLPAGPPQHPPNPLARRDGRQDGRRSRVRALPDVAATMIGQGIGEARLLHIGDRDARLRVYRCRECAAGRQAHIQGCSYTMGWLEGSLVALAREPSVRETACTARGGKVCEFEVRY